MCDDAALTFEALLTDPLTRLVMDADGVTVGDLVAAMQVARDAMAARERLAFLRASSAPLGLCGHA